MKRKWYKGMSRKQVCGSGAVTSTYAMLPLNISATTKLNLLHCEPQKQNREGQVGFCITAGQGASPSPPCARVRVCLCVCVCTRTRVRAGEALLPPATFPAGRVRFSSLAPTLCSPPRSCKWLITNGLAMASRGCVY